MTINNARWRITRNFVGGVITTAVGAGFLSIGSGYGIGNLTRMEAGFFPVAISILLIACGIMLAISNDRREDEATEEPAWRPIIFTSLALISFGICITNFGLIPAIVSGLVIASLSESGFRLLSLAGLVLVVTVMSWLIFIVGLRLPIPLVSGVI